MIPGRWCSCAQQLMAQACWFAHRAQLAATVVSPLSGRAMDLSTNAPGLQFYSGDDLNGSVAGKGAYLYPQYGGMALEAQVDCLAH